MPYESAELFQLAERIQSHLAHVTQNNAPSLRYSIILEELQEEARRALGKEQQQQGNLLIASRRESDSQQPSMSSSNSVDVPDGSLSIDFPLDQDLWLQLDSCPYCKCSYLLDIQNHLLTRLAELSYYDT